MAKSNADIQKDKRALLDRICAKKRSLNISKALATHACSWAIATASKCGRRRFRCY